MSAQALALHLDVEQAHQATPSQDAGHRRLRMIWFLQGMGLAALVLMVGVAAMGHSESPSGSQKPSGHLLASFAPVHMGLPKATNAAAAVRSTPAVTMNTKYTVANWPLQEGQRAPARHSTPVMQSEPAKDTTWNTAIDADGETYYWNSAGASTYEKPADYDPATAKASGQYKAPSSDGALYDDEVGDGPVVYSSGQEKPQISNTMRDRLINESRGLGADPNAKNPFLYVFAAVGVFVLLGAVSSGL